MKDKLKRYLVIADDIKDTIKYNKKKSVMFLIIALAALGITYKGLTRIPSAISCYYDASWSQGVPSELWRFNLVTAECQYYNGKRFIPLQKVMDVGAGDLDELGEM